MMSSATSRGLYCLRPPGQGLQMAGCLLLRPLLRCPHCACVCLCALACIHLWMCVNANTGRERERGTFTSVIVRISCLYVCRAGRVCVWTGLGRARGNIQPDKSVTFLQRPHQSLSPYKGECSVCSSGGLAWPRSLGLSQIAQRRCWLDL